MYLEADNRKRSSYRLRGYDYSKPRYYFITICSFEKQILFGQIIKKKMILNKFGKIAKKCILKIHVHYPNVIVDEYIIMPNHIHLIIRILKKYISPVGTKYVSSFKGDMLNGAKDVLPNKDDLSYGAKDVSPLLKNTGTSYKFGTSGTVGSIIRGFKIGVTKWCRKNTDIYNVWQNSYYDRIIRSKDELIATRKYIVQNPENWKEDRFFS